MPKFRITQLPSEPAARSSGCSVSEVAGHLQSEAACTLRRPCRPTFSKSLLARWYVVRAAPCVLGFPAIYLTRCLAVRFSNQRLGDGHSQKKTRTGGAAVLGPMWSALHEQPAAYPAFVQRTTRGRLGKF